MGLETALVVDDSATARVVLSRLLTQLGFDVIMAKSGEDALEILHTQSCDVVFLDHIMPGIDGFETLSRLKQTPENQQVPVIMYTSQAAHKYTQEAKALGALGVISKQVTETELAQVLDRVQAYQQALKRQASNDATRSDTKPQKHSPIAQATVQPTAQATTAPPPLEPLQAKPASPVALYFVLGLTLMSLLVLAWHTNEQNKHLAKLSRQIAAQEQQRLLTDDLIQDLNARQAQQIESWREQQFMLDALYNQLIETKQNPSSTSTTSTTASSQEP